MSWKMQYNDKYIIVYSNINIQSNIIYHRRIDKLLEIIENNNDKKIILKHKYMSNIFYFEVTYTKNKISFQLFSSLEECLQEGMDKDDECMYIYIYIKPNYYSVLYCINSENFNIFAQVQEEEKKKFEED